MSTSTVDLLVVGGGAAGMMAAITAAEQGLRVQILEKNDRPCRKLYITGKGRCNITNNCTWQECIAQTPVNGKFLSGAMRAFPPESVMAFFESLGCALKTERGQRVFPVSDRSADVIDALRTHSRELGILLTRAQATEILQENGRVRGIRTTSGEYFAPRVIFAVGGASYPRTGSTGDGYPMLRAVGHTIIEPTGSLVPLEADWSGLSMVSGLSLRNVVVRLQKAGKTVYEDFGEAVFTDFGLDGPTILSCSAHMGRESGFTVLLDLKPALTEEKLEARLLRDLQKYQNCPMETALTELYPKQLILPLLQEASISPALAANSLRREQRKSLVSLTKAFYIPIRGKRPIEEAIVTSGGVKVSEVNPKTMESKLLPGLYLAGEILDADAYTGGFNLQIAWATGHAAGMAASAENVR